MGNTGTSTLNIYYFQHAALELSVNSEFLLSGRLFLHVYVLNDICYRL